MSIRVPCPWENNTWNLHIQLGNINGKFVKGTQASLNTHVQ